MIGPKGYQEMGRGDSFVGQDTDGSVWVAWKVPDSERGVVRPVFTNGRGWSDRKRPASRITRKAG